MHPTRLLSLAALVLAISALGGCSEKAARIAGNERLIRGVQGLGTTTQGDTLVDRDTFVPPAGTAIKGVTLLVGRQGPTEARSLLLPKTWSLPDTNNPTLVIDSVRFRIEFDSRVGDYLPPGGTLFSLYTAGAAWDTTEVGWPGPALGDFLGSGPDDIAPFTIDLSPAAFTLVRQWATNASFPGFVLTLDSGQGVRGFLAGTGRIEIVSHATVGTSTTTSTVKTVFPTDVTIQTPLAQASGVEDTLALGGFIRAESILRAPVAPPPAGFSINGVNLVAFVESPAFPTDQSVTIQVYRIKNAWTEGGSVPSDTLLGLDATPLAVLNPYRVRSAGDSLVIRIPPSVARDWSASPATNEGVLIRVVDSFDAPEIRLFSRESASPPHLRVSTTTPPPGRF